MNSEQMPKRDLLIIEEIEQSLLQHQAQLLGIYDSIVEINANLYGAMPCDPDKKTDTYQPSGAVQALGKIKEQNDSIVFKIQDEINKLRKFA